ncbi:MAG: hypothetical protein ACRDHW_12005 [Ktedonobacteraceae bacterium]
MSHYDEMGVFSTMTRRRISKKAGRSGGTGSPEEKKPPSSIPTTALTDYELRTLKSVIFGYLGFLRNTVDVQPEREAAITLLQALSDRLLVTLKADGIVYFPHEELVVILEAIIGFKLLLVTCFPQTTHRDMALADVDRLLACLMRARSLPLN